MQQYIYTYYLLNDAVGSYTASKSMAMEYEMMCKEAAVDYFDVLSGHLPGKTRESHTDPVRIVCYRL
jgi:hypothetical protein